MKNSTKAKKAQPKVEAKPEPQPTTLKVVSAGLIGEKWGIVLSNGALLEGVEEIIQAKPSYSDGFSITAKIFVPFTKELITAEMDAEKSKQFHNSK